LTASDNLRSGGLGSPAEPSALRRLISVEPGEFERDYWAQSALLSSTDTLPRDFTDLLDEAAVDELIMRRGLRTPFLRVAKDGSTLNNRAFTSPGGVGATIDDQVSDDKLVRLFGEGSTMVLQALHRVWPPIIDFCLDLAADLGHPVQANAYITPPQNQGFSNHYDVHDVFVLQIAGEKEWTIHAPVHAAPLRNEPWTDRRAAVERRAAEPPLIKTVLRPGDCMYLPRGFLHAARARGGVSSHLTLGIHSWTRHALAERLLQHALADAAQDVTVRASLPLGVRFDEADGWTEDLELVRQRLAKALEQITQQDLRPGLLATARAGQRAAPIGPLTQLEAASALEVGSTLRLRDHLLATLEGRRGGGSVLRSRAGDFDVDADEVDAVRRLLEVGRADAATLGLDLSRRMIMAGLAVVE
jgi:bifunctional lysine-specific demethylase and histidyl-hydroxylase NO66